MSVVSLLNVNVMNNPAPFNAPYTFEVTFEALEQLKSDLEFKLLYVGSATSSEHDQELDSLLVGPVPVGVNKFVFEADAPNLSRIPNSEIIGVTVILLTCSYDGREFVRVGYYVNNEYADEELQQNPPAKPVIEKIKRSILAEKPRVTRFAIKWDSEESAPAEFPPDQPEADQVDDDEAQYGAEEEEEEVEEETIAGEGEDAEMGGIEETRAQVKVDDAASDAGSEDIENESEDDDEEDDEGEEGEGEAPDDEMDMGQDEAAQKPIENGDAKQDASFPQKQQSDVMVH
ncbi:histone deposition protein Asf1 [Rhizodiscina lignyota]|uniref:Histone chaperone n=1 Tax=Rhizodiscina lignyota TaxID=1504668 RepID=A0A9P4IIB4_9PEZI|nr:histone deposition protein Asf1 [Rhizodiscina lignyota]